MGLGGGGRSCKPQSLPHGPPIGAGIWEVGSSPNCFDKTTLVKSQVIQSRAKAPGPGQLGIRHTQGFYRVTQTLVDAPHSQEAVLDHNAGAGTAGCGHGREHLPLVLRGMERLCRLQDSGLVP